MRVSYLVLIFLYEILRDAIIMDASADSHEEIKRLCRIMDPDVVVRVIPC